MEGFQPDKFKMGWTRWYMTQMQWRNNIKEIIFLEEGSICLFVMFYPSELDAWGLKRDFEEEEKT